MPQSAHWSRHLDHQHTSNHPKIWPHSNHAPKRQGAGRRRQNQRRLRHQHGGALRSSHRKVGDDRFPFHQTRQPHGDAPQQRQSPRRRRTQFRWYGLPRYAHTATLLQNGKVLVAGGYNTTWLSTAELYDPAAGTWTTTGPLNTARGQNAATLLPTGKVLSVGGQMGSTYLTTAELYDPTTRIWTTLPNSMTTGRSLHTVTLLSSGKILVAGGQNSTGYLNSTELYDPTAGTWSATANTLSASRSWHTATLLPSGKVLVAAGLGGGSLSSAELFDPTTATWSPTSSLNAPRHSHTATLLTDGQVLIAGGYNANVGMATIVERFAFAPPAATPSATLQ